MVDLPPVIDYAPYEPRPFRLKMGMRTLDPRDWIEVDVELPAMLAEKQKLLSERHEEVFAALREADQGAQETLDLLLAYLPEKYPQVYGWRDDLFCNFAAGEKWDIAQSKLHPLEAAGRLVQEDFCLLSLDSAKGEYRLTAASLCFPTRWLLAEKMGRSLDAIHHPVPGYAAILSENINRLFARLKPEWPMWRINWVVMDDGALFQPVGHYQPLPATAVTRENAGDLLWLRLERQTLRRLPQSGDILFTIRIYNQPLSALAKNPQRAAQLAAALRGLTPDILDYLSVGPILTPTLAWLDAVQPATFASDVC